MFDFGYHMEQERHNSFMGYIHDNNEDIDPVEIIEMRHLEHDIENACHSYEVIFNRREEYPDQYMDLIHGEDGMENAEYVDFSDAPYSIIIVIFDDDNLPSDEEIEEKMTAEGYIAALNDRY